MVQTVAAIMTMLLVAGVWTVINIRVPADCDSRNADIESQEIQ